MTRRLIACLFAVLWALWAALGYHPTGAVVYQRAPGYPSAGQWHYYFDFPLAMSLLNLGVIVAAKRLPMALFVTVLVLQILVFAPFLLGYTGGM